VNTINNTGLNTDLYWQEETVKIADGTEQQLSQEDFFSMLTEQLANQDPTKPVDNDQMVAQMTSFTMADGISQLNEKFETFASSMTSMVRTCLFKATLVSKAATVKEYLASL